MFQNAVQHIRDTVGEPRRRADGQGHRRGRLLARRDQGLRRTSTARCCWRAALIVLVLLIIIYRSPDLLGDPVLHGAARRGRRARLRLPARRGRRDGQRPVRRHPAGARASARAPTTRCCSCPATARSCAATRTSTRRCASRCAAPGPAIFASGLTVIAALLTLSLAEVNGTAGLGPIGAMGVALAMISMLTMLPALLTICGRACVLAADDPARRRGRHRRDARLLAPGRRPRRARARARSGSPARSCCSCSPPNLLNLDTGLTSGNSFRGEVESVAGPEGRRAQLPGRLLARRPT